MRRLFFALWPEPHWAESLLQGAAAVIGRLAVRPVSHVDLHLTLCFLGDVGEAQFAELIQGVAALPLQDFRLQIDTLECWPQAGVLVAVAAPAPPAAIALVMALRELARGCDLAPEVRPFRAHLTLVRRLAALPTPVAAWPIAPRTLIARELCLAESHPGPEGRYRLLRRWPLRAAPLE